MKLNLRSLTIAIALCATFFGSACTSSAATIIKLNLGNTPGNDVQANAASFLTVDENAIGVFGDQTTDIEFTGFLDGLFADVTTTNASFTLSDLNKGGTAATFGNLVVQGYSGGTFSLLDP